MKFFELLNFNHASPPKVAEYFSYNQQLPKFCGELFTEADISRVKPLFEEEAEACSHDFSYLSSSMDSEDSGYSAGVFKESPEAKFSFSFRGIHTLIHIFRDPKNKTFK